MPSSQPEISLIIPMYNEGTALIANLREINRIMGENAITAQYILIDDGSTDDTWDAMNTAADFLPAAYLIRFSRNFGKEAALCAGLDAVDTPACVIMDADLQHPPAVIPEMYRRWKSGDCDVVEGVKNARQKEHWWNRLGANLFYGMLKKSSGIDLNNASDFKLLDAKVVAAWKACPEKRTFFRGLSAWVGYRRATVNFDVAERTAGTTHWSPWALFRLAVTGLTGFSGLPLQLITFLGVVFLVGAVPVGIEALYQKIAGHAEAGFTTVILLLLLTGGSIMVSLGIIGIYLARIFEEVKARPRYLVGEEKKYGAAENRPAGEAFHV